VAVVDGNRYELDEVVVVQDKRIQLVFERNRVTLLRAVEFTRQGEELGSEGRYEEALAFFRDG